MRKNAYTTFFIQFDGISRKMKFKCSTDQAALQEVLKIMKIQLNGTVTCSLTAMNIDYLVKVTGPQNFIEMNSVKSNRKLNRRVLDMVIFLDVGGSFYRTTPRILRRFGTGILKKMISFKLSEKEFRYMIDRDGKNFGYILRFLMTGKLRLPASFSEFKLLFIEVQYYNIMRE